MLRVTQLWWPVLSPSLYIVVCNSQEQHYTSIELHAQCHGNGDFPFFNVHNRVTGPASALSSKQTASRFYTHLHVLLAKENTIYIIWMSS